MSPSFEPKKRITDGVRPRVVKDISPQKSANKFLRPKEEPVLHKPEPPAEEFYKPIEPESEERKSEETIIIDEPAVKYESLEREFLEEKTRSKKLLKWGMISGSLVLVALLVVASTVFNRLTVKLKPKVEMLDIQDLVIALDASVSHTLSDQKVIPAERLEFSRQVLKNFDSTGKQIIQDSARGSVKIYNSFSSAPQTLVASTRFLTDSGLVFRLPKTIVIPGAKIEEGKIVSQSIDTELAADKPGENYNISGEIKLQIPGFKGTSKYDAFYAVASSGFSGGFKGEARVVSQDDLKRAQEEVTKQVFDELGQEISRKIPPEFKLLDALRDIQITKVDAPKAGTRRDNFPVEADATARVLIFRESDVVSLLKDFLIKGDNTRDLVDGSANLNYQLRDTNYDKARADVVIQGSVKTKSVISQDELAGIIKGQKEGSLTDILKNRPDVASFEVNFFPPWLLSAPSNTGKINFVIQNP